MSLKLKKITCNKVILIILLLGINTLFAVSNNNVIDFTYTKVISLENTSYKEIFLADIAEVCIKYNHPETAIKIFYILSDEYNQYRILFDLYNCKLLPNHLAKFELMENKISDKIYKNDILIKKIIFFLSQGKNKDSIDFLEKFNALNQSEKFNNFYLVNKLLNVMYHCKLEKEANQILACYEDFFLSKEKNHYAIIDLLKTNYEFISTGKAKIILEKLGKEILALPNSKKRIKFGIAYCTILFYLEKYEDARIWFDCIFNSCKHVKPKGDKQECFLNILLESDNFFCSNILSQSEAYEKEMIENVYEFHENKFSPRYIKAVMNFLVKKGNFKQAENIANSIDNCINEINKNKTSASFMNYYFYLMSKIYSKVSDSKRKRLYFINRIHGAPTLKLDILLEFITSEWQSLNQKDLKKLISPSLIESSIENQWERDNYLGDFAMLHINQHNIKKAIEVVDLIEYNMYKSILFYEICQVLIINSEIKLVDKILKTKEIDNIYKAYIYSKIAARYTIDGKNNKSKKIFKKAIELLLTCEYGDIKIILEDYFLSKQKREIKKTLSWHTRDILEEK